MVLTNSNDHMFDDIKKVIDDKKINRLYKYISFDENSSLNDKKIETLEKNMVYMSSPLYFNDPYDCELSFNILDGIEDFLKIGLNRQERRAIQHKKELKKEVMNDSIQLQKELTTEWEEYKSQIVVSCFSEQVDSFLMWSHYANCYNGICIEYCKDGISKENILFPVVYTNELIRAREVV